MLIGLSRSTPRASAVAVALLLAIACGGGDGPAGPAASPPPTVPPVTPPAPPPAALPLSISSPNVRALQVVVVGVRGVALPPDTIRGQLGSTPVLAARLDDTTLALPLVQGLTGEQELRFTIAGQAFATRLAIAPPIAVANPDAFLDSTLTRLSSTVAAIDERLRTSSDTVGLRALAARLRAANDSARKVWAGLTGEQRAAAASYLAVNGLSTAAAPSLASQGTALADHSTTHVCTATPSQCAAALDAQFRITTANLASCHAGAKKWAGGGMAIGLGGGAIIGGVGALPGAIIGGLAGGVLGAGYCLYQLSDDVAENHVGAAVANIQSTTVNLVAPAGRSGGVAEAPYRVGQPRSVAVTVEYRSLIAADVAEPGLIGDLARSVGAMQKTWSDLLRIVGVTLPGPTLPAAPATRIQARALASQLKVGGVSLQGATGSGAGTDSTWRVTFQNAKQGRDHDFTYDVIFTPPGGAEQRRTLSGILQPTSYAIASVASQDSLALTKGSTGGLGYTMRDSSGNVLAKDVEGRKARFRSQGAIARVDSVSGVVTAVDTGRTTVTVVATGARGDTASAVVPVVVKAGAMTFVYTLTSANGAPLPYAYETSPDGRYRNWIVGGSYALGTDGKARLTFDLKFDGEGGGGAASLKLDGTYVATMDKVTITITTPNTPDDFASLYTMEWTMDDRMITSWHNVRLIYERK